MHWAHCSSFSSALSPKRTPGEAHATQCTSGKASLTSSEGAVPGIVTSLYKPQMAILVLKLFKLVSDLTKRALINCQIF